ncbi:putative transcription factor MYB/SANT family [Lupinus albus]|uniref:Putative transcription factor MYB/SANT family n=1 Tax=Lupinus albus TaxID=3870 RepID=A0A6A4QX26_LUPAL|nr:putative transcription factor MYB/SANT family [Lupinus albus]
MPPESLHWDRKEFLKERKHVRSQSLGSLARWRDSSYHRHFTRWASPDFRTTPGHGKQGGWHLFPEESGHGYGVSRSRDKILEADIKQSSVSRGDGRYGKYNRENRGSFGQRYWRGHSLETTNSSLNMSRRPPDVKNDQRSDVALTYSSHSHSDFVNTWDQHHSKDQHDNMCGVNGFETGPRCGRGKSLGSVEWMPLKWTRSGGLSSRGPGFRHCSRSRSMGGEDSYEAKIESQPKNGTTNESHSSKAAACVTYLAPSDDKTCRKKPRLNWGEGLAKYEKKKVDGPDVCTNKGSPVSNMGPSNNLSPHNAVHKSPKVSGFSECASPATPPSVACISSPGVGDKLFGKTATVDNDVNNLTVSAVPGFQDHLQRFSFNLEKLDIDSLSDMGASITELIQSDDPRSVDSGPVSSSAMDKLLIWKADISKVLERTESEIDSLETELKSLKSESGDRCLCPAPALGSQLVCNNEKPCEEYAVVSDKVPWPEPLKIISSGDLLVDKRTLSTNLHSSHENDKEGDIDTPGTSTSKFEEPLPLTKVVSSCDTKTYDNFSGYLDAMQSTGVKCLGPCATKEVTSLSACGDGNTSMEAKDGMDASSGSSLCLSSEDILYNTIISSNKESADRACEVFANLLPKECCEIGNTGGSSDSLSHTIIMEKFAERKLFARFKEKVVTLKFKALRQLWKEDMRLLHMRKGRPKSHKRHELSVRSTCNGIRKNRSAIRSHFSFPGDHISLVPTSEILNYTSKLLSEPKVDVQRNTLQMPALILDEMEKMVSKFISSNGLVEDPLAIEKERTMINPWTAVEREIYLDKYAVFGKDFRKIASFLDHKTTADCVEFYYKNHKFECFEKFKKQYVGKLGKSFSAKTDMMASGRKWNHQVDAASLEILSAASVMVDGISSNKRIRAGSLLLRGYGNVNASRADDSITDRSAKFDIIEDERETVAADVLAGICGTISYEASITSSVDLVEGSMDRKFLKAKPLCEQPLIPDVTQNDDDGTCSDESCGEMDPTEWTDEEKASFLQAVSSFGKDFTKISQCVGRRSQEQCKVFFSKARKCLGLELMHSISENAGSPVNDDVNDGGSGTDDGGVVETCSADGTDKSGMKTDEDLPSFVMNTYHDDSPAVEGRKLSVELKKLKEINGAEVDHEDVNVVSDACASKTEPKVGSGGSDVMLYSSVKSCSVSGKAAIIMSDNTEVGKGKADKTGGATTELISAQEIFEPCKSNSVDEDRLVSDVFSEGPGNELGRQRMTSVQCLDDRDDKREADTGAVAELKCSVHGSSTTAHASISSVGNSCSLLSFDTENKHVSLGRPHMSAFSSEDHHATANSLLQNTAAANVKCKKIAVQDRLSSTSDFQGSTNMHCHSSIGNGDHQLPIPGNHVEAISILRGYPLQAPIKKEVSGDMNCSSSTTELPLLSKNDEQADHQFKTRLQHLLGSEKTSRNGDVKLFGKILTNPSSSQKPNLTSKASEEKGIHHSKLSSKTSGHKFSGHHNDYENLKILKFDHNDYLGHENVPLRSYDNRDGNGVQTCLSSLPDSAILLAKYPAAFGNYSTSSAKLEQQSLQAFARNNERHVNGAFSFTTRDTNGSNALIDYQMFRSRDGLKAQPFMVDVKHRQDLFSELQRRNGFEAISTLQHQGRGMVGMNSIGRPGILMGGVSDPVAAIKIHYSNYDKYGGPGQSGSIIRNNESWGGKGDLGR